MKGKGEVGDRDLIQSYLTAVQILTYSLVECRNMHMYVEKKPTCVFGSEAT